MGNRKGSILIFSLWVLMLLSIFAVHIGLRVRERIDVVSRIETRSRLHHLAQAAVKKAIALIRSDLRKEAGQETAYGKYLKYNNPEMLSKIVLNEGIAEVSLTAPDAKQESKRYGVVDEESKININVVDRATLRRLIQLATNIDENQASFLAEAIIDWREPGRSQLQGFDSDSFYASRKHPYSAKDAAYESIDELMLVEGMNKDLFEQIKPYVTIFGNGQININTASVLVLKSLGLDEKVIDKFLSVRRGLDAMDSTVDDYIFYKTYDIASEMKKFTPLEDWEVKEIDQLNASGRIKTSSVLYDIVAHANISEAAQTLNVECVYNTKADRVEYYREKF